MQELYNKKIEELENWVIYKDYDFWESCSDEYLNELEKLYICCVEKHYIKEGYRIIENVQKTREIDNFINKKEEVVKESFFTKFKNKINNIFSKKNDDLGHYNDLEKGFLKYSDTDSEYSMCGPIIQEKSF